MPKRSNIILSPILIPLSLTYGLILYIRNKLYDFNILKSHQFDIPIISVGNITVGGTGKTPHIEYLVSLLKHEFKPATLSRGYKRKTKGFILSTPGSTDRDIGDEPMQIKQKFPEIDVAVDANRVNGIKQLIQNNKNIDVILLDDAYQHRKVTPGLSILLIDHNRPINKDFILPLGRLREQAFEQNRANIIIITKCPEDLKPIGQRIILKDLKPNPFQTVFFTSFDYGNLIPVFNDSDKHYNYEDVKDYDILMATGIANPKPLKEFIEKNISKKILALQYPDHYDFEDTDIKNIQEKLYSIDSDKKMIITTEKDAMRLQKFSTIAYAFKSFFYYIPIRVQFLNKQTDSFNQHIIEYVRKNQPNSLLYTKQI